MDLHRRVQVCSHPSWVSWISGWVNTNGGAFSALNAPISLGEKAINYQWATRMLGIAGSWMTPITVSS